MKKIWNAIAAFYWHVLASDEAFYRHMQKTWAETATKAFYRHMQKTSPKSPAQGTLLLSAPVQENLTPTITLNPLKNGKTSLVDATGKTIGIYTRRADAMRAAKRRGLEVA